VNSSGRKAPRSLTQSGGAGAADSSSTSTMPGGTTSAVMTPVSF
jgi:hypothetical protein